MSTNPANTIDFIGMQHAGGGGDFPEAVDHAMQAAVEQLEWSEGNHPRILFLLLDAPPHQTNENIERLKKYTQLAIEKGIRIVPISASGINKMTEFLMKDMAILSNGEYLYITDDSKIGNSHLKPTGGESKVDYLNDLMVDIINSYSKGTWCKDFNTIETAIDSTMQMNQDTLNSNSNQEIVIGQSWHMKFYPNPAANSVKIDFSESAEKVKITNLAGQTLFQANPKNLESLTVDISEWNTGLYIVQVSKSDETLTGKLLIMH